MQVSTFCIFIIAAPLIIVKGAFSFWKSVHCAGLIEHLLHLPGEESVVGMFEEGVLGEHESGFALGG